MRRPFYTLPFVIVYKIVIFPFMLIKYFFVGLYAILHAPFLLLGKKSNPSTTIAENKKSDVKVIKSEKVKELNRDDENQKKKQIEEQKAAERAKQEAKKAEQARLKEAERKKIEEQKAIERAKQEAKRAEQERIRVAEKKKIEEQKAAERAKKEAEHQAKIEKKLEEKRRIEEKKLEERRILEAKRIEKEKIEKEKHAKEEEERRIALEKKAAERKKIEEQKLALKAQQEAKRAEQARLKEEERARREEERLAQLEKRLQEKSILEAKRAEEKRIREEKRAEEKRILEAKKAEEKRQKEEKKRELEKKRAEVRAIVLERKKVEQQKKEEKRALLLHEKQEKKRIQKEKLEEKRKRVDEVKAKHKEELQQKKLEHQRKIEERKALIKQEKLKKAEEAYIKEVQEKEEKKQEIEKKKKKKAEEKELRKKRWQKDEYTNEKAVIETKSATEKMTDFLNSLTHIPEKIKNGVSKKYENLTFVKNMRNKRDINRQALLINFEGDDAVKSNVKILYEYVGKNADGKVVKGYFEAFSKVEVHSYLLSEGFEVYSIKTSKWIQFFHGGSAISKTRVKTQDLIFFTTQLSTYIKAGIALVDSLKILSRQFTKKKYQKIFKAMIYDLTMGESFSEAMSKQGEAFPKLLVNMIKTAEMTGELPEALDDMADYFTQTNKTRKQMITAMMYPSIIFVISLGVSAFIMVYVVPKFADIYSSMGDAEVPAITRAVMSISDFLENNLVWVILAMAGLVGGFVLLYKKIKLFKTLVQWTLMHIPVFGNVIIYNEVTMFTKTFASLLKHNVFITDSMEILNKITDNEVYKMLILDTITNLAKGEKISKAFENQWSFPIPAYEMLVTGEKTGQLPEMMQKVSDYYQELHSDSVTRIKTFVEPIMIIFLTVIVGVIVLSIVIPMFGMYQAI